MTGRGVTQIPPQQTWELGFTGPGGPAGRVIRHYFLVFGGSQRSRS
jgi:hypothetical protein